MKSQDVRKQFLDFFESKGHLIVPSAPIVLKNDPTLMFNNSGMAQFKEYFLGIGTPKSKRIADTQKCLRVSGKHNDLEEVGIDTYHHTMFEMLGNWSFGDYFKKEAINWAWELLTEVYKIPKDILYVSVFEGNPEENVPFDQEAFDIWKTLISEDRIILGNKKDNFWEMGDQGPCGPCSEIHVDIRSAEEKALVSGKSLVNNDHPHVVEIWNNVFMEFNRKANGSLEKLPAQHVDTGMGFERLCMVLQGVQSNYDTDVFTPLIKEIELITGAKYTIKASNEDEEKINIAIRVIADHVRAVVFSIADGQLPSNTGAGYVIRRILRRAIRYGFTFLNTKEPFIYKLVETLSNQMGGSFPEIKSQKTLCTNVIREEEASFLRTLDQGLQLLENVIKSTEGKMVSGQKAFELYDTFGFPIDLTALILRERGLELDEVGFDKAMLEQKTRSRAASEVATDDWVKLLDYGFNGVSTEFVGYDKTEESPISILQYRKIDSKKGGVLYQLVLDKTPFYPEGGGQVGDKGILDFGSFEDKNSDILEVIDTKKENNLIIHITKSLPKNPLNYCTAKVNQDLRLLSSRNHSATHLMHQALRSILGTHVEQKGSLVNPDHLRFDFSHFAKLTNSEIQQVEDFVNERIQEQLPLIERRNIPFKQAVDEGAMALFGEKYGDSVRAIKFGDSIELCGGIHVKNTAEIWHFKIVSEGAVAAGIRRIEAITSDAVKAYFETQEDTLTEVKNALKNPQDVMKAVHSLQDENIFLKKRIDVLMKEKIQLKSKEIVSSLNLVNGIRFVSQSVDFDANFTKDLAYISGSTQSNSVIVLGSISDDKPSISCYVSDDLVKTRGLNASVIVRNLGKYIDGGGGGQPNLASAGGKRSEGLKEALEKAIDFVK